MNWTKIHMTSFPLTQSTLDVTAFRNGIQKQYLTFQIFLRDDILRWNISTNRPRRHSCPTFACSQSAAKIWGNTPL